MITVFIIIRQDHLPDICAPTGPCAPRSQMSLNRLGLLRQSVTKVVPFPVALAGVPLFSKEVWKSSKMKLRVHNFFKLFIYDGLRRMIKIEVHQNI